MNLALVRSRQVNGTKSAFIKVSSISSVVVQVLEELSGNLDCGKKVYCLF